MASNQFQEPGRGKGPSLDRNILVLDVDGVLLLQKYNGAKETYVLHEQAKAVVARALRDFDEVVLWTASEGSLSYLLGEPFSKTHQRIAGIVTNDQTFEATKPLGLLSGRLSNVAAIEDLNGGFSFVPRERVISMKYGGDLHEAYEQARDLIKFKI